MGGDEWVAFLQWALPRLGFRWAGFRRVRGQVCKRIARRMAALGLADVAAYRARLAMDPAEWAVLDSLCRITISRFYRDRDVFDHLRAVLLPELAALALGRGERALRCWSAGCAGGEEPYTLAIMWHHALLPRFPGLTLELVATDADDTMLARARRACYRPASLRDLPPAWRAAAFEPAGGALCLGPPYRAGVAFRRQDIRVRMPRGPFHLLLCRNLAFTYFDRERQRRVLRRLARRMAPGGALVLGKHEALPDDGGDFLGDVPALGIYRWRPDGDGAGIRD